MAFGMTSFPLPGNPNLMSVKITDIKIQLPSTGDSKLLALPLGSLKPDFSDQGLYSFLIRLATELNVVHG